MQSNSGNKKKKGENNSSFLQTEMFYRKKTEKVEFMKKSLERLYRRYHRREYVHPDPLEFLYRYPDVRDREIAGLVSASLAYGRVAHILNSVSVALEGMDSPADYLDRSTAERIFRDFRPFRHRFTSGEALAWMLIGVKRVREQFGGLENCFLAGLNRQDKTVLPALEKFVEHLEAGAENRGYWILASPAKGSACKRLNLFLRWMVRQDEVDPGGWDRVPARKLVVPLDTHIHRIGLALGMTTRKQAGLRTALELTEGFRKITPRDPVKYDFTLTRFGIRNDLDYQKLLREFHLESEVEK
jgi:uncharacterized protein (TIGR02757 family)